MSARSDANDLHKNAAPPTAVAKHDLSNLVSLDRYLESLGRSRTTFWRWQKKGLIRAVNVSGRNYVTRGEIRRFEQAAVSGLLGARQQPCRETA
jgi:hypothetical protein